MIKLKKMGERSAHCIKQASADKGALPVYKVEELTHVPMVHRRKGMQRRVAALPAVVDYYLQHGYKLA